ncbi:MAG: UMP kinase [Leptotrichiaceae bacterium]|nr:UMP kinase [Leptotrichiaceae bacterium]MBP6281033.1 UMP kinase [Leptotrichiaceae bacterium]MBP7101512.1 UMP kinase [Leptotrichiaceae bacterium]MBP7725027.1 UMP kinase [Leptotrichiaceae bacterium]MBP9629610.1 UMP kinase [Leptotrichiaceae bacterium]
MFKYKRILLKLSGEALAGNKEFGFSEDVLESFAKQIKDLHSKCIEIAIVIGGGNIFRGTTGTKKGVDRVTGDTMGMLATIMNGLALQDAIERLGVPTRVLSALQMPQVAEPFIRRKAIRHLEKGRVIIFAGGTGNPYFTTDSCGALRAAEINADVLAKGTKVDGIYNKDPMKHIDAVRYDTVTFDEAISKNLGVMDTTALSLCRENNIPIIVFNALEVGNILKMVQGENIGTVVEK